jgi:hypothetical protein
MILGAEIGMLMLGIYAIVTGRVPLTKTKVLTGPLARPLGSLLLAPIPVAYLAHGFLHAHFVTNRKPVGGSQFLWTMIGVEGAIVIVCLAIFYIVAWANATDPTADQRSAERS